MKNERRLIDIRAADADGPMMVEGYAAVFNQRTLLWESEYSGYKYFEIIDPHAMDGADMTDVVMRYNHSDGAMILARTSNNTLQLTPDEHGLKIRAELADTTAGRDMYALIKRGDISKMSFAFAVAQDMETDDREAKEYTRRIQRISLVLDVSPVDFPAYDGTAITARRMDQEYFRKLEDQKKWELIIKTYF